LRKPEGEKPLRILIIRHGDPNYEDDCLTEKGFVEADLLAKRLKKEKIDFFYVSPYRRARQTAQPTLKLFHAKEVIYDWLHEFDYTVTQDDGIIKHIPWDLKPLQWTEHKENFTCDKWGETDVMRSGDIQCKYDEVIRNLDQCLAEHGYVRKNQVYQAENANTDTIAFFCHFGLEMVLLSHLLNLPVVALWHGAVAAPSSVTTLCTEEREKGAAYFRMNSFGDVSHLSAAEEPVSFQARFCEVYDDFTQRH
jgi:probable phosphoglycerate mutase